VKIEQAEHIAQQKLLALERAAEEKLHLHLHQRPNLPPAATAPSETHLSIPPPPPAPSYRSDLTTAILAKTGPKGANKQSTKDVRHALASRHLGGGSGNLVELATC
jgi:hypothetical protein